MLLRVCDDGHGLPLGRSAATSGTRLGLAAMRQRAEELGGSLVVTSPASPGDIRDGRRAGTLVQAALPVSGHCGGDVALGQEVS